VAMVLLTIASGCSGVSYTGIRGETVIAPLSSILSRPVTTDEEPDFYKRRWMNGQPHRGHYQPKDREWSSTYELRKD
jgi:hypothetical protein